MARAESCHCKARELDASFGSPPLHVALRCWIYPASSIGRRFGRETKLSKVDMINCFYFLFEICTAVMVGFF
ncbi:hypothetical protein N7471_000509 [Penicillium samsonianum]|uniref:uncharacterized protein n=1 Tax=Penicillium samsonianum TaxID=1882272 RepID=UPI002548E601|nr:uncharacterized protein N7471_000509 [Penicillium samsonianum]KAJ6149310.1 hypothetical protein N7471_000509 [Penicillium samsonianum]